MNPKTELRAYMKEKRNALLPELKKEYDEIIFNKIISSDFYKNSKYVFSYVSFGSEADTIKIIKRALSDKKHVFVPKVLSKEEMKACEISSMEDMAPGKYGILEPKVIENSGSENVDLIITPGLAFDKRGGRLGYGGGYYDRFFKSFKGKGLRIGLCYDFQITDKVPLGKYDVLLDKVICN